eukprot:Gregarina_sp_Poly_1__7796@NODE_440_length_8372_cov_344_424925_g359_i0_p4_GENE_NODE_440_length_8372_cov_344_424925_g359_i0NODE_440_length_8372_cov_344_424925_g359_i0_p4_ORF_typecomplete_len235_score39_87_NODE_440_length_8372_cov_344_424925_g359_i016952399
MSANSSAATQGQTPRLRERLLLSLKTSGAPKKPVASSPTNISSLKPIPDAQLLAQVEPFCADHPKSSPTVPQKKSSPKQSPSERKKADTRFKNNHHHHPQRLLKRLPQAKILGDVDLEKLMKDSDLVVLMNQDEADEASSSFDASVAEERGGLKVALKSALKSSSQQKLSKKVLFIGGDRSGGEVDAIYLYEAIPVEVPWSIPKFRGAATKAPVNRLHPNIPNPVTATITFRAC